MASASSTRVRTVIEAVLRLCYHKRPESTRYCFSGLQLRSMFRKDLDGDGPSETSVGSLADDLIWTQARARCERQWTFLLNFGGRTAAMI
jgi:hypothetical protein